MQSPNLIPQENPEVSVSYSSNSTVGPPTPGPRSKSQPASALVADQFTKYAVTETCRIKQNIQPRVICTSIVNLWNEWRKLPFDVLFDCILILPCDRRWFFNYEDLKSASHDVKCKKSRAILSFLSERSTDRLFKAFQSLCLQKERQGLLLWLSPTPTKNGSSNGNSIDPRWLQISQFLSTIRDPVTHIKYHHLQLKTSWWEAKFQNALDMSLYRDEFVEDHDDLFTQLEFCSKRRKIEKEIHCIQFKYKPMLEILHQSNPTMVPMWKWSQNRWNIKCCQIVQFQNRLIRMGKHKRWDTITSNATHSNRKTYLRYDSEEYVSVGLIETLRVKFEINPNKRVSNDISDAIENSKHSLMISSSFEDSNDIAGDDDGFVYCV